MGSNMAECHPVGFQWVMEASERGAKVIHVDPRFTRTSAMADLHVPLRAGTDVAFLGGVIRHIIETGSEFREYVVAYTNAKAIIDPSFEDTEELGGLFSGWDPETHEYDPSSWGYEGADDETLEHERCAFQHLRRHFARYTPEMVERVCGVPKDLFLQVADALCENSGRERTSAICYAVGWTQHTTGVQNIRAASIVQLLLGNIGRPGGGILALRGHANIQGSTDIPTLYNILPGYVPMPHPQPEPDLQDFVNQNGLKNGVWGSLRCYVVSMLKAWWGDAATEDNQFCFGHLPRIDGDHSIYPTMLRMIDRKCRGFFVVGENPVVGGANSGLQRRALASLDWLVVRDLSEIESASFWYDAPEIESGELRTEDIATEVFFLPAAAYTEKAGCFTNTQRLLQWHHRAIDPPGDCRSELHWMYDLGRRVREKLAESSHERDRPILELTWDYPTVGRHDEPDAQAILQEINGRLPDGSFVSRHQELADDGSTACGSWIHAGIYADGVNQAARRRPHAEQDWVAGEWGWAWPADTRILYNRASADPDGEPWSERKRYVWWDSEKEGWTGSDHADFVPDKHPDYVPDDDATGLDAIRGSTPFIMHPDGLGWIWAPTGLVDGPVPTHYEPHESPVVNPLYAQGTNPTRQTFDRPDSRYNPSAPDPGADVFPYVFTTYRLTEHHTAGGMSRVVPLLSELQPEAFCEVSPALAAERRLEHGGWATIVTSRTAIEARVLVTVRMKPLVADGRTIHQIGIPYHWGSRGLVTGDSANELVGLALDSNVHISEYKAATCDIQPGRRPRGAEREAFVDGYRRRAQETTG